MVALIARWKSDNLGLSNGASVTSWPDTAGVQGAMSINTAPVTYVTNALNGMGVVRIGINARLATTWAAGYSQPFTAFMVIRTAASGISQIPLGNWAGNAPNLWINGTSSLITAGTSLTGTTTVNAYHLFTCHFNNTTSIFRQDGVVQSAGTAGTWPMVTGGPANCVYGGAATFDVAEYVIYTGDASDPQIEEDALMTKWFGSVPRKQRTNFALAQ